MTSSQLSRNARRARQPAQKAERRDAIVAAASTLISPKRNLPSVEAIALKARVAKGTIYLYFATKEEVYLGVLSQGFALWLAEVERALAAPNARIDGFVDSYCRFCRDHPHVLYLASLSANLLERNVREAFAIEFKSGLAQAVAQMGKMIARLSPGLTAARAARLFVCTYATTMGLWQYANPPPVIDRVLDRPGNAVLRLDFVRDLRSILTAVWGAR